MNSMLFNALLLALREIRRNILRSLLTVLGIVIGVAAVISLVTIGNGATIRKELFGNQNPVGEALWLGSFSCSIIGVLATKGQSLMGNDQDDLIVMPLKTVQRRLTGSKSIKMIQLSISNGASTETAVTDIENLLRERRQLADNEKNNFNVMDMKEIATVLTSTTKILAAVAAVSLLVGGIGIMNIMLVSVTERTREIGIRLAIGAMEREVLLQFLVEAAVLSGMGGITGILLALVASFVMSGLIAVPFVFEGGIVALAFLFSVAVGIVFGYFPALKAARMDPIDALRYE